MAKLYTAIFLFLILATMHNLAISAPQQPPLPPLNCGPNSSSVNFRSHDNCYENCQNKDQVRPCLGIQLPGPFCECKEGFIFRNGTAGDCIKREDCPK